MSFIPNTTPTPNWLYNGEMKKMNGTELKVVMQVTRATLGFELDPVTKMRKQQDWISHSQLVERTGCCGDSVSKAVDSCVKQGWIETRDKEGKILTTVKERQGRKVFYRLGSIFTDKLTSRKSEEVMELLEKDSQLLEKIGPTSRKNPDIQNKYITKENNTNTVAPATKPFSFKEELEKLKTSSRKDFKIIALYWIKKNYQFENKLQFEEGLKRELRPAKSLLGYTGAQINSAINYCRNEYDDKVPWTLETVGKRIADLINSR